MKVEDYLRMYPGVKDFPWDKESLLFAQDINSGMGNPFTDREIADNPSLWRKLVIAGQKESGMSNTEIARLYHINGSRVHAIIKQLKYKIHLTLERNNNEEKYAEYTLNKLHNIIETVPILDVIGAFIPVQKQGASWVAHCPFHKERSKSFHINIARNIFYCFGCHIGGTVVDFVMRYNGINRRQAMIMVCNRTGISINFNK